jgi:DNA-binding LacI/PurR family transcriptional regulator
MTVLRKRRATISDVANLAGVSIATVSRVVNGTAPVAQDTVDRVQRAIAMLGYTPHAAARKLAGHETGTLGVLLPEVAADFFFPLVRGIAEEVRSAGYDLLIHVASSSQEASLSTPLGEHNTDGLLIFTGRLSDEEITRMYHAGFPIVLLYRSPPGDLPIPYVMFENKKGARELIEHVITAHGRRRIAYLRGPEGNEDSEWRERGYREALEKYDIPFDGDLVGMGGFDADIARETIESWLLDGLDFNAVFAGDDEAAMGVMAALRNAGKQVPDDVAVLGFDDINSAKLMAPPLTTVRAPIEAAAAGAAQALFAQINGQEPPHQLRYPTEVVIRQSCGCSAD